MKIHKKNIHPVFDRILERKDKELLMKQHSKVIWLTGLSGSGKTTLAIGIERELQRLGFLTKMLDGDNVRTGISNNLGFSTEERKENIRRIAEVSKLFLNCGIITINCFISPTIEIRKQAFDIIGKEDFLEIYVNAPVEVCEQRDIKGLYQKAKRGEIKNFTGVSAPFEPPLDPFLEIQTFRLSIEESVSKIMKKILPIIEYKFDNYY